MIHYSEIVKLSSDYGVLNDIVEKDYCITWLLIGMSREKLPKDIVFYGGSAIKKVYFPKYRFSEDMDFLTEKELDFDNFLSCFEDVYSTILEMANLTLTTDSQSVEITDGRLQFFVKYDDFSAFSKGGKVKIDLFRNAELIEKPIVRQIILNYSDTTDRSVKFPTYSVEALLTEKISAMTDRTEPRDLYDVWFLLKQKGIKIARVRGYLKKKYGYEFSRSHILPHINKPYDKLWKERLESQIFNLPELNIVREELTHYVNHFFGRKYSVNHVTLP